VVFGAWGVRDKGKGGKWEGHELKKLTGKLRRSEGREEAPAFATVAARCQPAGARAERGNGVASAGRARREGVRAALELGATRGGEVQQEVARGGRKWQAAVLQQRSRAEGVPEEEEREKKARGRCEISQTSRDSDVKLNFLTALGLKQKCDQNESCTTF
jgi:hypothetical protein